MRRDTLKRSLSNPSLSRPTDDDELAAQRGASSEITGSQLRRLIETNLPSGVGGNDGGSGIEQAARLRPGEEFVAEALRKRCQELEKRLQEHQASLDHHFKCLSYIYNCFKVSRQAPEIYSTLRS